MKEATASHCLYNTGKVQQQIPTSSAKFWSKAANLLETSALEINSSAWRHSATATLIPTVNYFIKNTHLLSILNLSCFGHYMLV